MKKLFFVSLFVFVLQFGASAQNSEFNVRMKLANSGDFQSALVRFRNSFTRNLSAKKTAQIHYNIGVCLYRLNQADKAIAEFEQAIKLNPNYGKAFYALGMAFSDSKNFDEAEKAFRSSLKLSNNGETWFDLAIVFFELKKFDESAESFQNAIKFGSESIGASHNNLGVVYALKGNFELAEKQLIVAETLKFEEAKNNLQILRKAMITNNISLIAKLILKEKNER
ncbi:MAG: tetratricopeptide repeat protein [Blastocatellia bacterium]|nr:tetratricopeptide repeat protein [Blastocatellia bacterium]